MTANSRQRIREAYAIGNLVPEIILARIKAIGLLIYVTEKMERLDRNVSPVQLPLEQTPKVFDPICMYSAVYIALKMIDDLMDVIGIHGHVCGVLIGIDQSANVNVGEDRIAQRRLAAIWNHFGANLSVAFQHSHDNCFALSTLHSDVEFRSASFVHIASFPADERLINFYLRAGTADFHKRLLLEHQPKALQHEPRRLLCDLERPRKFATANAVFAVDQHPQSGHPLVESEGRILKYCSQFQTKLLLADVAEPQPTSLDKRMLRLAATRTDNITIGPAKPLRIVESAVRIGKINDGFLETVRSVHAQTIP